jgi:hypothetical protein
MSVEGLYLTIGFLLGALITGCVTGICILVYWEWFKPQIEERYKDNDDIFN